MAGFLDPDFENDLQSLPNNHGAQTLDFTKRVLRGVRWASLSVVGRVVSGQVKNGDGSNHLKAATIHLQADEVMTVGVGTVLNTGLSTVKVTTTSTGAFQVTLGGTQGATLLAAVEGGVTTMALVGSGGSGGGSGGNGGGGGGGGQEVIWEWNKTDLSQFDVVGDAGFSPTVTTWSTRFAGLDPEPAIRYENPGTSGGFSALLIKTSELAQLPDQYIVEFRMSQRSPLGTQDLGFLPYYESDLWFIGTRLTALNLVWTFREGSTTYLDGSNNYLIEDLSNTDYGNSYSLKVNWEPAGIDTKPFVISRIGLHNGDGVVRPSIPRQQDSFSAGWQSLGSYAPRIGWMCRTFGNEATAEANLIAEMRILSA